jgi:very-short-patch-repair endonuclease
MNHERELFSRPRQTPRRKELRNNLTPAEAALWSLVKNSKLAGRKFRRQQGIGSYIVDFCCPAEHLVIELDGEVHNDPKQAAYDLLRDEQIRALGFRILRFENKEVFVNTEAVLAAIVAAFGT